MKKISVTPKHITHKIPAINDGIEFDDWRRLRNALIALASLDVGWLAWVDQHVPSKLLGDPRIARRIVERQARKLTTENYSFWSKGFLQAIIDSGYYFTDDGNLRIYK